MAEEKIRAILEKDWFGRLAAIWIILCPQASSTKKHNIGKAVKMGQGQ